MTGRLFRAARLRPDVPWPGGAPLTDKDGLRKMAGDWLNKTRLSPPALLNRRSPRKIAEPRWWYTAVPKHRPSFEETAVSEQDSTCAPAEIPWDDSWLNPPLCQTQWLTFYFDLELRDLESRPATYVVIGDGVVQYVGSTRNLRARMAGRLPVGHTTGRMEDWWVQSLWGDFKFLEFKVRYSTKYGDWAMRELRLIRRLRPLHNIHHEGAQGEVLISRDRRWRRG